MKKKQKQRIVLIAIVSILVGGVIGYNYYIDQIKIKGGIFSTQIEQIQDDVKQLQTKYFSKINSMEEGDLTKEEFLEYSKKHFADMEELILKYDDLDTPAPFISSVEFLKLSTESQLEGDREIALWIDTGKAEHDIRATELYQESATYELTGLGKFKEVQLGNTP